MIWSRAAGVACTSHSLTSPYGLETGHRDEAADAAIPASSSKPRHTFGMSHPKTVQTQQPKKPVPLPWNEKTLAELSARFGVPTGWLKVAVTTAQRLPAEVVNAVSRWVDALANLEANERRDCAISIATALEMLAKRKDDPLDTVDGPMGLGETLRAHLQVEQDVHVSRSLILSESVSAEQAAQKSGRSRQNLEAMRRKGQALALRVRHQWRYPAWQFDPDGVGGIVSGIGEVLACLRMSPAGAALWLIQPSPLLKGGCPLELLRQGRTSEVVNVAQELGHTP